MEYAFSLTHQRMSIRFALCLTALLPAISCRIGTGRPSMRSPKVMYAPASGWRNTIRRSSRIWRGPESWRPGPRLPVAQLLEEIIDLDRQLAIARSDISSTPEYARGQYLAAQLTALRFAAERQLGRAASIDDQARDEFGVAFAPLDQDAVVRVHDALNGLLPGDGPLADRVNALRRAHNRAGRSPRRRSDRGACRMHAREPMPSSSLLLDEGAAPGLPRQSRVGRIRALQRATSAPRSRSTTARSMCRERCDWCVMKALAAITSQHVLDRSSLSEQRNWPELQLTPGFGPHLLMTEGAAEVARRSGLTRQQRETLLSRSFAAPGRPATRSRADAHRRSTPGLIELLPVVTDVARQYLDGTITREARHRAADRRGSCCRIRWALLAFIERRRARALVYGEGRRVVYALMQDEGPRRPVCSIQDGGCGTVMRR